MEVLDQKHPQPLRPGDPSSTLSPNSVDAPSSAVRHMLLHVPGIKGLTRDCGLEHTPLSLTDSLSSASLGERETRWHGQFLCSRGPMKSLKVPFPFMSSVW